MKIQSKISRYTCLLLMISMLFAMLAPNCLKPIKAEDEPSDTNTKEVIENGLFIVEKTWLNDKDENQELIKDKNGNIIRPTSVNIRIEGSNNSVTTATLSDSEGWKKAFILPTKEKEVGETTITNVTYAVYETDDLDKYVSTATSESRLSITKVVKTGRDSNAFNVIPSGFSNIEQPIVSINPELDLSKASKSFSEGSLFTYATNRNVYTNPETSSKVAAVDSVIFYNGPLSGPSAESTEKVYDNSIQGTITLRWEDSDDFHPATDIYGNTYSVKMTLSNIVIRTLTDINKEVAIISYKDNAVTVSGQEEGRLMMQSYVGSFTTNSDSTPNIPANIVGVRADIKVQIENIPDNYYAMAIFDDIDIPDHVDYYAENGILTDNTYFGLKYPFAESVQIIGPVSSDVHISNGTTYLVYDTNSKRFASRSNPNDSDFDNKYTMMTYLTPAKNYMFRWAGSVCGTDIFMDVYLPDLDTVTNTIENESGLYKVRYFFQKENGEYSTTTPDKEDALMMVTPGEKVYVDKKYAKIDPKEVDSTKTGYELDKIKTDMTTKTEVTTANDVDDPVILDVYFKKNCIVVYHDNINEDLSIGTLWDPDDETTSENLYFESVTPAFKGFDGDVTKANPGYKFTGWSIVNPENREETPLANNDILPEVDRVETHYLAHWEALPNKYIVEYYYEKNGQYPPIPDDTSPTRTEYNGKKVYTDSFVKVEDSDLIPDPKMGSYVLNDAMKGGWQGTVPADGLVLKVYFKQKSERLPYEPPVTGID